MQIYSIICKQWNKVIAMIKLFNKTVFTFNYDCFTTYYINRYDNMRYNLKCKMSGCGTDTIITGSLGQCYKELLKHI